MCCRCVLQERGLCKLCHLSQDRSPRTCHLTQRVSRIMKDEGQRQVVAVVNWLNRRLQEDMTGRTLPPVFYRNGSRLLRSDNWSRHPLDLGSGSCSHAEPGNCATGAHLLAPLDNPRFTTRFDGGTDLVHEPSVKELHTRPARSLPSTLAKGRLQ